jgi:hypothetical protein
LRIRYAVTTHTAAGSGIQPPQKFGSSHPEELEAFEPKPLPSRLPIFAIEFPILGLNIF